MIDANEIRTQGRVEHPERNKVVLERNGVVINLLSIGEASSLRIDLKFAGIKVYDERKPVAINSVPQVVSTFCAGSNIYRMYAL